MRRLSRAMRVWRAVENRSQDDLAKLLGISRSYVAAVERGYVPPLSLIEKIAEIIGYSVSELIQEEVETGGEKEGSEVAAEAFTPVYQRPTTYRAMERAKNLLARAHLSPDALPPNLYEFLCTPEAAYLKVTPEEVVILKTLRFRKGQTGDPSPEEYLDFLVTTLRPGIPREGKE